MKIEFCDLCNESVPLTDLEAGRAKRVKGRVICARCDQLMKGPEGQGSGAGGSPPPGATRPAGERGALPHAAYPHVHVRPRGGGGGVGLAFLALLGVGGVGFWLYDRSEQQARATSERLAEMRGELAGLRARIDEALAASNARADQEREAASQRLDSVRQEVAQGALAMREASGKVDLQLGGFDQRLASMQETVGEIRRHDKELVLLQQKFSELNSEVTDLGRVLADLADEQAAVIERAAAPVEPQAAWMGLVGQLSSPDDGDRWQAVIALGETRDPAAAAYLIPVLKDADIFVRMAAARMLGDLRAADAVPALIDALEDPEPSVREAVYLALKEITRRDLPFDALSDDPEERAKRVRAWREWWEKEQGRLGG